MCWVKCFSREEKKRNERRGRRRAEEFIGRYKKRWKRWRSCGLRWPKDFWESSHLRSRKHLSSSACSAYDIFYITKEEEKDKRNKQRRKEEDTKIMPEPLLIWVNIKEFWKRCWHGLWRPSSSWSARGQWCTIPRARTTEPRGAVCMLVIGGYKKYLKKNNNDKQIEIK